MKKGTLTSIIVVGIVIVAAAVLLIFKPWAGETVADEPYVIGAFFSVTGNNAPLGTPERDTILMLVDQINEAGGINGHPLQVIMEDDATDPTNSVKAVMKLLDQDGVLAVVGGSGTTNTLAVVDKFAEAKRPFLTCCAGSAGVTDPVNPWVFRTPQTSKIMIERIIAYLNDGGITKVGVIYDSNSFGTDGRDLLRVLAPQADVTITTEESFNSSDKDFTVQLTKIKNSGAQAIICWGTNPAPALIARDRVQLGIDLPLIMSHGVANDSFLQVAGDAAEGIVLPAGKLFVAADLPADDPQRQVLMDYAAEFEGLYGRPADTFGGHAWDGLQILVAALEKSGPDPAALRDAIEKTSGFVGIGGVFTYSATDHDGLDMNAVTMLVVEDGQFKLYRG